MNLELTDERITLPSVAGKSAWKGLWKGEASLDFPLFSAGVFLFILAECAAVFWVIRRFNIESEMFRLIVGVAFLGFAVHHFLPLRFRLPFFLALSTSLIFYCVGLERAQWNPWHSAQRGGVLFGVGLGLIGICRLPIRYAYRVAMLFAVGAILWAFRAKWASFGPLDAIWPVLGAMFMYRIACYIYDLEHEKKRSSLLQACAYFFLFPNLWLFVFPVIDYNTFIKNYFNDRPYHIYQRGLKWMMRGVIHLLLWRLVYYQIYLDPAKITNGVELAQFLLANICLFLRVSGQFHFAIGLLHLFGFHLPETNFRYFLASSFIDYWRRVNPYKRDFMMKICYYPLVVRFKKLGKIRSVVAAIALTFTVVWFLHPYQWFWIRGDFKVQGKDLIYFSTLGLLLVLNSVVGLLPKKAAAPRSKMQEAFRVALRTAGTFSVMTVLWSVWTCDTFQQWLDIWKVADRNTLLLGAAAILVVVAAYLIIESPIGPLGRSKLKKKEQGPFYRWPAAVLTCVLPAALLVAGSSDRVMGSLSNEHRQFARSLFSTTPNKSGQEFLVRGYYENLMDVGRVSPLLEGAMNQQPADWQLLEQTSAVRVTNDLRTRDLVPNQDLVINGVRFKTNQWAMRDSEYALEPRAGTTRIAVLGSSITMGWNVAKESTFEALAESELNQSNPNRAVEMLNFAVNGYSIVSLVEHLDQKVLAFRPRAVMIVSHPEDPSRAVFMLAKSLAMGVRPEYEGLKAIIANSGVDPKAPRSQIERKLGPFAKDLTKWSFGALAKVCKDNGILPVMVYLPGVLQQTIGELDREMISMATSSGLQVIPLLDVYSSVPDRAKIMVAPWDAHPNAEGHGLIAKHLVRQWRELPLGVSGL